MPPKNEVPRTFITKAQSVEIDPHDWDVIQEVFFHYLEKKRRFSDEAERCFKNLWIGIGETNAYTPVVPIKVKRKKS